MCAEFVLSVFSWLQDEISSMNGELAIVKNCIMQVRAALLLLVSHKMY